MILKSNIKVICGKAGGVDEQVLDCLPHQEALSSHSLNHTQATPPLHGRWAGFH